jgi:cytochrome c556
MSMKTPLIGFAIGLAILAGGAVVAGSHVDKSVEAAVKARKAHMQLYAYNLGILGAMAKEEAPYDAASASAAAGNLAALARMNEATYWPQGSDSLSMEGTRALPDIWDNIDDVLVKAKALTDASAAMEAAAGTGLDGLKGAMGAVGGACGACHKAYRQPDS